MSDDLELIDFGEPDGPWLRRPPPFERIYVVTPRTFDGETLPSVLVRAFSRDEACHIATHADRRVMGVAVKRFSLGSLRIGGGWS